MSELDQTRFCNVDGLLVVWPKKQVNKELVIKYLATKFEFEKLYDEQEVNEILKKWHTFSDWPLLRRELFERDYFNRNTDGSGYIRLK